ncbi:hypothetical protein PROFUN_16143, partial [Planoprotostelium fungivorum]
MTDPNLPNIRTRINGLALTLAEKTWAQKELDAHPNLVPTWTPETDIDLIAFIKQSATQSAPPGAAERGCSGCSHVTCKICESFPKDGIPPLGASRCTKSTSGSSHIRVTITEGLLNITKGLSRQESTAIWTIYNTQFKEMNYGSENDITGYVRIVMTDVLKSLGLSNIEILSEVSVYELRPDLYAITRKGLPIGVFEVKKPPLGGGKEPMDDQAVHAAAPVTSSDVDIPVRLDNQLNEEKEEFIEEHQDTPDIFDFKGPEGIQGRCSRIFEWNDKELPDLLLTTMMKMSQTRVDSNNLSEDKRKYIVLTKTAPFHLHLKICAFGGPWIWTRWSNLAWLFTDRKCLCYQIPTWTNKHDHRSKGAATERRGRKLGAGLQCLSSSDCNKWNSCINYAIYLDSNQFRDIILQAKELSIQTSDQLIGNLSHQAEFPHSKDSLVINCQGGYQSSLTLVMTVSKNQNLSESSSRNPSEFKDCFEGIRGYVSRNHADFKDYLDEISAEAKYFSTISRLVKKENGPDARNRIRRRILQAAENSGDVTDEDLRIQNTKIRGKNGRKVRFADANSETKNFRASPDTLAERIWRRETNVL